MMTVGSLFSGIGGIELGLERTGHFETVWFVEKDKYAQAVLKKHWPGVKQYDDITKIDWRDVERPDLLTGGFPCQDISYAGKGLGIKEGTRSGLWKEYYEAIRILRPRFVLVENVSALLNRGLDIVLGDLAQIGYDAEWHCVTASSVGAPHRRDRIFIIAYPNPISNGFSEHNESSEGQQHRARRETWSKSASLRHDVADSELKRLEGLHEHGSTISWQNERLQFGNESGISKGRRLSEDVADSSSDGCKNRCEDEKRTKRSGEERRNIELERGSSQAHVANTNISSMEKRRTERKQIIQAHARKEELQCYRERVGAEQWAVEPNVGRVADGVSRRVDRIRCLGNAVVPQVAQFAGEMIWRKTND